MRYLHRPRERLKDPIGGFRTDWSGPVTERMVNSYRKISINNLELKVPGAPLHEKNTTSDCTR